MDKILCKGISKIFPQEVSIKYQDLCFERGRSYLILGGSGCGKSTLLNMIAGILEPAEGIIEYDLKNGEEKVSLTSLSQKERDRFRILNIGYVYQDFKLIDEMSVEDNLNILRLETKKLNDIGECLEKLGIGDKRRSKVADLSGGQKQRVAVARAILKNPQVLLADEPTGNLNAAVGRQIVKELTEMSKDRFLIVVSHDESLREFFTDVVVLDDIIETKLLS